MRCSSRWRMQDLGPDSPAAASRSSLRIPVACGLPGPALCREEFRVRGGVDPLRTMQAVSHGSVRVGAGFALRLFPLTNRLHHVRDVSYDEDRCRVRSAHLPRNLACLTNLAVSIVRLQGRFDYLPQAHRNYARRPGIASNHSFRSLSHSTPLCTKTSSQSTELHDWNDGLLWPLTVCRSGGGRTTRPRFEDGAE